MCRVLGRFGVLFAGFQVQGHGGGGSDGLFWILLSIQGMIFVEMGRSCSAGHTGHGSVTHSL